MGLPISRLTDDWETFEQTYNRVENTGKQLFKIDIDQEKKQKELDDYKRLRQVLLKGKHI